MKVDIVKFDNQGRGIGYIDEKIIFVPKTIPGDVITVNVIKEKKNYLEGILLDIIKPSKLRKKAICPYFDKCGGCDLMHISLSEALEYKLNKVNEILKKNNMSYEVKEIIKSDKEYNYRNKISLKIVDKEIGFFKNDTHELIKIDYCYLCKEPINNLISDLKKLNIINGKVTIRCNYNDDLLVSINSNDNILNLEEITNNHRIVGVILNDDIIYGEKYFLDKINDYLFKVSYNSFFQINPDICSILFNLIEDNTKKSNKVLDLYCGVGTLSNVASKNAKEVLGIEIVNNAIIDANFNKTINNKNNLDFICADTKNILDKITIDFDTLILDPPRSGVVKSVIDKILETKPNKIIYVSCDPFTLVRDLKLLCEVYDIVDFKLLDMFPKTHHVESFVVLKKRERI